MVIPADDGDRQTQLWGLRASRPVERLTTSGTLLRENPQSQFWVGSSCPRDR